MDKIRRGSEFKKISDEVYELLYKEDVLYNLIKESTDVSPKIIESAERNRKSICLLMGIPEGKAPKDIIFSK